MGGGRGVIGNENPGPPPFPHRSWALRVGGSFMALYVHRNHRAYWGRGWWGGSWGGGQWGGGE